MQLVLGPDKPSAQPVIKGPERVQMKWPDGSAMVQVGPHLLVINHLRPYSDWEYFRPMILDAFSKHEKISRATKLARIGLRYINQIKLPEGDCRLETITTLDPKLTGVMNRPLAGMYQRFELEQERPKAVLIVQVGTQRTEQGNFVMLDFDIGSQPQQEFSSIDSVATWLNDAHERIDEAFLAAVNPDLIEKWKRGEKRSLTPLFTEHRWSRFASRFGPVIFQFAPSTGTILNLSAPKM